MVMHTAPAQGDKATGKRAPAGGIEKRQAIVNAALQQFAENGYPRTTMSGIARAAGLDQSSLYYWFANKEDILKFILESNRESIRIAVQVASEMDSIPDRLHAVLCADVMMLCNLPFDYYDLEAAALEQPDSFGEFIADYRLLRESVCQIIAAGVDAGCFRQTDANLAAIAALAFDEGMQHRYRQQQLTDLADPLPAQTFAETAARITVSSLGNTD